MKAFIFILKIAVFSVLVFFISSFIGIEESWSDLNSISDDSVKINPYLLELQSNYEKSAIEPEFVKYKSKWIDSVFNSLSLDEKISQLIMVATYSNKDEDYRNSMERIVKKYRIGGFIFFQGSPVKQVQLTNYYQSISKTPLFIAMDAEWGPSMRLDSTVDYPRQMMMGAIQNDQVIYDFGLEIGRQCNRLGVHINFAPVIDINNNHRNPVINSRSFGEERLNVAQKGFAYMLGMQEKKIIPTAKHFPGHGDTESDSHKTLPVISHSLQHLDSMELFPFKYLIDNGLAGVMVAHLHIPALDSSSFIASSLSYNIISLLLKQRMKFKGLVFTDALGMQGVSNYNSPGDVVLKAFMAGSDMLLMPTDIEAAIRAIKTALNTGLISEADINEKCYKVLQAKKWAGLDQYKPIEINGLIDDLNSSDAQYTNQKIIESAITLVENKDGMIPLQRIDSLKIATVSIGSGNYAVFQKTLSLYDDLRHFSINKNADINEFKALMNQLANYDIVIIAFLRSNYAPSSFGITSNSIWFANELSKYTKVIVDIFASPYVLSKFKRNKFSGIIMSYEDTELCQDLSAQLIYGGIPARGKLPVSSGPDYPVRSGISDEKIRLKYANPKELNIDDLKLKKIDSIVLSAIDEGVFPGCQVLAAKNGIVFFNKSYGYHTYEKKNKVNNDDLYDLASITKISATLPLIMQLSENGKININDKLSKYIPELDSTNKNKITLKQILAHQAGLVSWIPFYLRAFSPGPNSNYTLNPLFFSSKQDTGHLLKVAENLYMNKSYVDTMYQRIYNSPIRKKPKYLYSDLGFYLFYQLITKKFALNFPEYLDEKIYAPMGLTTFCFNPLNKFPKERIIPTENDKKFRKQLVQGYVHDYGAAMIGGVCGHAGLFSNANDLAKLMQMYLQMGKYGGEQYIQPGTVKYFTTPAYPKTSNRRALGFDKPGMGKKSPVTKLASPESFGHTGFTGTVAWVDPKQQFVFVFLSNRINPSTDNNKINQLNIRTKIHEIFYQSFN